MTPHRVAVALFLSLSQLLAIAASAAAWDLYAVTRTGYVLRLDPDTGDLLKVFVDDPSIQTSWSHAWGADGNIYITSQDDASVRRYDGKTGTSLGTFVQSHAGGMLSAQVLRFGPDGNLYVADTDFGGRGVYKFSWVNGAFLYLFVSPTIGGQTALVNGNMAFGPDGYFYLQAWPAPYPVQKYSVVTGELIEALIPTAQSSYGMTWDHNGHLLLSATNSGSVLRYSATTGLLEDTVIPSGYGGLIEPTSLLFGQDGDLYVCDDFGRAIRRYDGTTFEYKLSIPIDLLYGNPSDFSIRPRMGGVVVSGRVTLSDYAGAIAGTPVEVTVRDATVSVGGESHPVVLASDGSFATTTTLLAPARVLVKAPHWLRKSSPEVVIGTGGVTGLTFTLTNGDVDGDNAVTVFDYNILSTAFDSVRGGLRWDARADLDGDGNVTVFDYSILSANFDLAGD